MAMTGTSVSMTRRSALANAGVASFSTKLIRSVSFSFSISWTSILYPSAPSAPFFPASVVRHGRNILDDADAQPHPGQCTDRCLRARPRIRRPVMAAGCPDLDVDAVDALLDGAFGCFFGGNHGRGRRRFHAIGFNDLPAGTQRDGLGAGDVGDMDERVVI